MHKKCTITVIFRCVCEGEGEGGRVGVSGNA